MACSFQLHKEKQSNPEIFACEIAELVRQQRRACRKAFCRSQRKVPKGRREIRRGMTRTTMATLMVKLGRKKQPRFLDPLFGLEFRRTIPKKYNFKMNKAEKICVDMLPQSLLHFVSAILLEAKHLFGRFCCRMISLAA